MALGLVTAGESHGPALVAIVDRAARRASARQGGDRRRPAAAPAGVRPQPAPAARDRRGRGAQRASARPHARHAARARRPQPRPRELAWGMSPWPPEGEPAGKGVKPVTLPRPGHADLAGVLKYGHDDVRNALERASARHTAVARRCRRGRQGAAPRARDRRSTVGPVEVGGATTRRRDARRDRRGARRTATRSAASSRSSPTGVPPGLGSYAEKARSARCTARVRADGDPGGERRRGR